jgi:hypothetical protein
VLKKHIDMYRKATRNAQNSLFDIISGIVTMIRISSDDEGGRTALF